MRPSRKAHSGGVAERLNAPVLKTGILERVSGVRIPPPPPKQIVPLKGHFLFEGFNSLLFECYQEKIKRSDHNLFLSHPQPGITEVIPPPPPKQIVPF